MTTNTAPSPPEDALVPDPEESAEEAGLRYVTDTDGGVSRRRAGMGWAFFDADGRRITDEKRIAWFKRLAIPPAWTDVWICPDKRGHLQATGRDARGRKVYRYHPRWREVREDAKYGRMLAFARALPMIRKRVEEDLARPGLPREKVLAAVVALLERTRIRVGNEEYARDNRSFGLTTLRDRHARIKGGRVTFQFKGKSGKEHAIELADRRLARIVERCQDIPGQQLFQYVGDDGERRGIASDDVNAYLHEIAGERFTAKDFRTWAGTVLAAMALQEFREFDSEAEAKKNVVRAIESVAEKLGNTPAVSRASYVHPQVIDAYLEGDLLREAREEADRKLTEDLDELTAEEAAVYALLRQRLSEEERRAERRERRQRRRPKAA
ncbi:MAG TPA: DNA topoisomerase IB [Candidatus Limnocylindria bacterium]|nr:DNA topoisomerase IB [Candidatus Limnocylindria bacterium]